MAITSLLGNNIADIGNLVFFTEKGYQELYNPDEEFGEEDDKW